jgi:hypothetical protein
MGPTIKLALLCDYAFRTQDNKLCIIGVFSQISVAEMPGGSPPFFVVISLGLEVGTHHVHFGLVDPMGQQALPDAPTFDVEVETAGADTDLLLQFNGLPLQRPGIYQVQLFVEGRLIHSIPMSVQGAMPGGIGPIRAS